MATAGVCVRVRPCGSPGAFRARHGARGAGPVGDPVDLHGSARLPPYHPGMMVALLLYRYSRGVYSSRQLARECEERIDFMARPG